MRIIAREKRIAMNFSGFYVLAKLFCKHGFFKSLLIIAAAFVLIIALLGSEPGFLLFLGAMVAGVFIVSFIYYFIQGEKEKKKKAKDREERLEKLREQFRAQYPDDSEDIINFLAETNLWPK